MQVDGGRSFTEPCAIIVGNPEGQEEVREVPKSLVGCHLESDLSQFFRSFTRTNYTNYKNTVGAPFYYLIGVDVSRVLSSVLG